MSTTITEPEVKPSDTIDQWPPVAHLIRKEDQPTKPGDRALCGAKLMGIDLGDFDPRNRQICPKCAKVWRELYGL